MRGRKPKSGIRQNIVEILSFMKTGYGYEIYKIYRELFPKATMRSIYYNLRKGKELGEFEIKKIGKEKGSYSWGEFAEKTYYSLGKNAKPLISLKAKKYFEEIQAKKQNI